MVNNISSQQPVTTSRPSGLNKNELLKSEMERANSQPEKHVQEAQNGYFEKNNKKQLEEIVKGLNEFLNPIHTSIKFELHEKLNEYYVTVVDDSTKEVIREIPSKKMLDIYAAMAEIAGVMIDKKI